MNSSDPAFPYTVASAMIHPEVESGTGSGSVTFEITPKTALEDTLSPPLEIEVVNVVGYSRTLASAGSIKTVPFRSIPNSAAKVPFRQRNKDRKYPRKCRPVADP